MLKRLAGQTAIYGISTLLVRLINYVLFPLHTRVFLIQSDFGIISIFYAYSAFLNVLFMYGMETAFFRFATKEKDNSAKVFKTASTLILSTTTILTSLLILFSKPLAAWLGYPDHADFVILFSLIIGFDTVVNIPFAKLRLDGKPLHYMAIKLLNVTTNVGLNLFFLLPALLKKPDLFHAVGYTFHADQGIHYVFYANLIASAITLVAFLPMYVKTGIGMDKSLIRKLWAYGSPLIIVGFAGIINEVIDRLMLNKFLPGSRSTVEGQVGIYSACYKLAIFMNLMVQAFRMGAEPFFFKHADRQDAKQIYADVMLYFSILSLAVFLVVVLYLDQFALIIGEKYRSGIFIVPSLLIAYFFLGVFYNLSTWYKVTDRTKYATIISIAGAFFTVLSTYLFIPPFGILAGALGTVVGYGSMSLMSYIAGQRFFPVPYKMGRIAMYFVLAMLLYLASYYGLKSLHVPQVLSIVLNSCLLIIYLSFSYFFDFKKLRQRA